MALALEGGELGIGERLTTDGDQPKRRAGDFQRVELRGAIKTDDNEADTQQYDGCGLHLEEAGHFRGKVARPVLAQLLVTSVLSWVVSDDANGEVSSESCAP